jgi:hypothetical protein
VQVVLRWAGAGARPGGRIAPVPAMIEPAGAQVVVGHRLRGEAGRQVGRRKRRQRMLGAAGVGETDRAHLAVAPRLPPEPFDRVVAVRPLQREGIPFPFRVEAPAYVLQRDDVAVAREELRGGNQAEAALVIRRAFEDDGEGANRAGARVQREVEVGGEAHAIPHRNQHVALDHHVITGGRSLPARRRVVLHPPALSLRGQRLASHKAGVTGAPARCWRNSTAPGPASPVACLPLT